MLAWAEQNSPRRGEARAQCSVHPYKATGGDPTPLLHPPDKSLAWPWSEDTPGIESAWVRGFCTHTVNTGRLASLWRDCGILTWDQKYFFGFR